MRPLYDLASVFADQLQTAEAEAGRVYEPVIGIVTDNKDPDKLCRVKIKIPILSDQDSTFWCPIVMLGAGKNRGWFFIPEKDDEVLVIFEHGDVNRPVVIGALWNGKDKPPDKNPGGNPRRVIKSRQGSKITFDDDKCTLVIEDGTGKGKITFDSNKNTISVEAASADVCIQSPAGDMTIVAQKAEFKATNDIEIHAASPISIEATGTAKIGSATIKLSGSTANANCGQAGSVSAPSASPQDVADPYGS